MSGSINLGNSLTTANPLSNLSSLTSSVGSALQSYIVSPTAAFGIGGFVFGIDGEDEVALTAEITDHYAEDNTVLNDGIAIKPKRFTLRSYVGEQQTLASASQPSILEQVAQKLTVITSMLPAVSAAESQVGALLAGGTSNLNFSSLVSSGANIYAMVKNLITPTTGQAAAYAYFQALFKMKILMSVQTPYEFITNMAIESVIARQDEDTKNMSHFIIVLKEFRMAQTLVAANVASGAAAQQGQAIQQLGNVTGAAASTPGLNPAPSVTSAAGFAGKFLTNKVLGQ